MEYISIIVKRSPFLSYRFYTEGSSTTKALCLKVTLLKVKQTVSVFYH